jgi:hypothetical protein
MESQTPSFSDPSQLALVQRKLYLDGRIRNGVSWFFWIAGLSILNTILYTLGMKVTFVIGLGVTQFVDGFLTAIADQMGSTAIIARLVQFGLDIAIAGVFVFLGIMGLKRKRWPVIAGIVFYTIDAIIMLAFKDIMGVAFHAFALFGIVGSLKWMKELATLESTLGGEPVEALRQRMPSLQAMQTASLTPQQRLTRVILSVVLMAVVFIFIFILMMNK